MQRSSFLSKRSAGSSSADRLRLPLPFTWMAGVTEGTKRRAHDFRPIFELKLGSSSSSEEIEDWCVGCITDSPLVCWMLRRPGAV